jgi:hypothetical protein
MILYRMIIPLGILTWLLVLFAVLTGLRIIKVQVKWHKRIALTAIVLATIHALIVLYSKYSPSSTVTTLIKETKVQSEEIIEISQDGIFTQLHTDTTDILHVTVRAPTEGWVSIGFDATVGMKDANIIIGYVKDDTVFIRDDYGVSPTSHAPDTDAEGKDNILYSGGFENEDYTEIRFGIPLDSGDKRDRALEKGKEYTILLAYGDDEGDDFTSHHKKRLIIKTKL